MLYKENGVLYGSERFAGICEWTTPVLFHILECGHYFCNSQYQVHIDHQNAFLLLQIETGELELQEESQKQIAKKGDILLFSCESKPVVRMKTEAELYWFCFQGANSRDLYAYITEMNHGELHEMIDDNHTALQIRNLVRYHSAGYTETEISRTIYTILCGLMKNTQKKPDVPRSQITKEAVQYIDTHLCSDLSLRKIAESVHISTSQLIRLFRQEMNQTPHEYVISRRIDRAKYLLRTTNLPIKAVASEVGFFWDSSFSTAFTDNVGISPYRYRKNALYSNT